MKFDWQKFDAKPLIAILRGFSTEQVTPIVEALLEGGIETLEITHNSPDALESIASVVAEFGAHAQIGVGTVCCSEQVYESQRAGASFVVTPIVARDAIAACKELELAVFCGAMSPTEIYTATQAGADVIKLFPAAQLGPDYLRAVSGPFDDIRFLPTGGIGTDSIAGYLQAGAYGFGIGGSLFPAAEIAAGNYAGVRSQAAAFCAAYQEALKKPIQSGG